MTEASATPAPQPATEVAILPSRMTKAALMAASCITSTLPGATVKIPDFCELLIYATETDGDMTVFVRIDKSGFEPEVPDTL